jgi:predicted Fe-Mo cluster-binding NifX family protein
MRLCIPVDGDGQVDPRWGRAHLLAVADIDDGVIIGWWEHEVAWDLLHDADSEGAHHARVARFLREHAVQAVVAGHMGPGMLRMLRTMGLTVYLDAHGDAHQAVAAAAAIGVARSGSGPVASR